MTDREQYEMMKALISRVRQLHEEPEYVIDGMAVVLTKCQVQDAPCPAYEELRMMAGR